MATFSEADITITLTGAQWFALLARLIYTKADPGLLSAHGERVYHSAMTSLQVQLTTASQQVANDGKL